MSVAVVRSPGAVCVPALSVPLANVSAVLPSRLHSGISAGTPPATCTLSHWAFLAARDFFNDAESCGAALANPLQDTGDASERNATRVPDNSLNRVANGASVHTEDATMASSLSSTDAAQTVTDAGAASTSGVVCDACTFLNVPGSTKCEVCESPLRGSAAHSSSVGYGNEPWLCICCGYLMPASSSVCYEKGASRSLGIYLSSLTETDLAQLKVASAGDLKDLKTPFRYSLSSVNVANTIVSRLTALNSDWDTSDPLPPLVSVEEVSGLSNNFNARNLQGIQANMTSSAGANANALLPSTSMLSQARPLTGYSSSIPSTSARASVFGSDHIGRVDFGPKWVCPQCTFENDGIFTMCSVCSHKRYVGLGKGGTPTNSDSSSAALRAPSMTHLGAPPVGLYASLARIVEEASAAADRAVARTRGIQHVNFDAPIPVTCIGGSWRTNLQQDGHLALGVKLGSAAAEPWDAPAAGLLRAAQPYDLEAGVLLRGRYGHGLPLQIPPSNATVQDPIVLAGRKAWGSTGDTAAAMLSHERGTMDLIALLTIPPEHRISPSSGSVAVGAWRFLGSSTVSSYTLGEAELPCLAAGEVTVRLDTLRCPIRCAVNSTQCVTGALDVRGTAITIQTHESPSGKPLRTSGRRLEDALLVNKGSGVAREGGQGAILYAGLVNMAAGLSNVCYQNSLIQSLFMTEELRERLLTLPLCPLLLPNESNAAANPAMIAAETAGAAVPSSAAAMSLGWESLMPFSAPSAQEQGFVFTHALDDELGLRIEDLCAPVSSLTASSNALVAAARVTNRLQWLFARLAYSLRGAHASHALQAVLPVHFSRGQQQDVTEWHHWLSERVDDAIRLVAHSSVKKRAGALVPNSLAGPFEATFGGTCATVRVCVGPRTTDGRVVPHSSGLVVPRAPAPAEDLCGEISVTMDSFTSLTAQFPGPRRAPITGIIVFVVRRELGQPLSIKLPAGYERVEGGDIAPGRVGDLVAFLAVTRETHGYEYNSVGGVSAGKALMPITGLMLLTQPTRLVGINRAAFTQTIPTNGKINPRVDAYDFPPSTTGATAVYALVSVTDLNFCAEPSNCVYLYAERASGKPPITDIRIIDSSSDVIPQQYELVSESAPSMLPLYMCREKWLMQLQLHAQSSSSYTFPWIVPKITNNVQGNFGYYSPPFELACKDVWSDSASRLMAAVESGIAPPLGVFNPAVALLWTADVAIGPRSRAFPITDVLFVPEVASDASLITDARLARPALEVTSAPASPAAPSAISSLTQAMAEGYEQAAVPTLTTLLGHHLLVRRGNGFPITQVKVFSHGEGQAPLDGWEVHTLRPPAVTPRGRHILRRLLTGLWTGAPSTSDHVMTSFTVTGVTPTTVIVVNGRFRGASSSSAPTILAGLAFRVKVRVSRGIQSCALRPLLSPLFLCTGSQRR